MNKHPVEFARVWNWACYSSTVSLSPIVARCMILSECRCTLTYNYPNCYCAGPRVDNEICTKEFDYVKHILTPTAAVDHFITL